MQTLKRSIPPMLAKLKISDFSDLVVYAPETRSSSPVRICRNENGESVNIKGIFPAGEGAGYAGGIVSSAIDGIKAAQSVINDLSIA